MPLLWSEAAREVVGAVETKARIAGLEAALDGLLQLACQLGHRSAGGTGVARVRVGHQVQGRVHGLRQVSGLVLLFLQ